MVILESQTTPCCFASKMCMNLRLDHISVASKYSGNVAEGRLLCCEKFLSDVVMSLDGDITQPKLHHSKKIPYT